MIVQPVVEPMDRFAALIVSRYWAGPLLPGPGQRFMNLLPGLCLAPAAQLLDLENNEELNLKVSIIPAAVWLMVAGQIRRPAS